ncbi:MAG: hypothetical protein ACFFED_11800 [Candidatus Thorarchaeota archaeon]
MSQMKTRMDQIARVLGFSTIYTAFGLLMSTQGNVTISFAIGTVITALLYGVVLRYASLNMPISQKARIAVIWFAVYVIQLLNPVLEGLFFSTQFEGTPELAVGAIIFGSLMTLPTAVAAGVLFKPEGEVTGFRDMKNQFFNNFTSSSFGLRFILASVLWMGIYFVFGSIVAPLVLPYYTAPGSPFNLVLPSIEVILSLQTLRGFIYTIGVLPLVISLDIDKRGLAFIMISLLYIGGALAVFIISEQFAVFLRVIHGIELFADSVFAGLVISALLGKPKSE